MEERRSRRRGGAALLFLLAILATGCRHETPVTRPATPVRVAAVTQFVPSRGTPYSANISPYAQVNVSFKSAGYIVSILQVQGADGRMRDVQGGDYVHSGVQLAAVRASEYQDKVRQAQGQLAQARAAQADAQANFRRAQALYASQSLTQPDYDSARAKFDSSTGQLEAAQAALAQARTALNDCVLRAPLTGWVLSRNVDVGSLAGIGTVGFTIVDTHLVKAVFGIPDTALANVRLGSPEIVATPAVPGRLQGRITSIAPAADPKSRVYAVEVTLPNPHNRLRAGMIVTLVLNTPRAAPLLVVPLSAMVQSVRTPGGFAVFTVERRPEGAIVHRREISIGPIYGNQVAVTSGLRPDEEVVTSGATMLKDAQAVQIVP